MQQTPFDTILSQIASNTEFSTDEIYIFYILNKYGQLNSKQILDKSKTRTWQQPIPNILEQLEKNGLVTKQDKDYQAESLKTLYKKIEDRVNLSYDDLLVLIDFV